MTSFVTMTTFIRHRVQFTEVWETTSTFEVHWIIYFNSLTIRYIIECRVCLYTILGVLTEREFNGLLRIFVDSWRRFAIRKSTWTVLRTCEDFGYEVVFTLTSRTDESVYIYKYFLLLGIRSWLQKKKIRSFWKNRTVTT